MARLNGAWILIATGFLLFLFIVIQRWIVSSFKFCTSEDQLAEVWILIARIS